MSTSKKHHYVPQMYLRNFADTKLRTQVVRLETKQSTTARISTVAATNHFTGSRSTASTVCILRTRQPRWRAARRSRCSG
ncbi:DUF4238 domain-containing protein [Streptomyces sp. GbtcB7]|uniref:DUF4238 domain-containing protein n=1 Tax=Streptomyces sp. GbtcB7 TaxID=2824752 RepID=UPI0034D5CF04